MVGCWCGGAAIAVVVVVAAAMVIFKPRTSYHLPNRSIQVFALTYSAIFYSLYSMLRLPHALVD